MLAFAASPATAGWLPEGAFSSKGAGTTTAPFLNMPAGARSAAMGSVMVAASRGSEALFHNPALLARFHPESRKEVSLDYGRLLEGGNHGTAAFATPLGREGALGAGLLYAGQPAQTSYDTQGNAAGTFRSGDLSMGMGYARRMGTVFWGAGLKVLRSSVADRSASGAALDFGFMAPHASELGDGPLDLGVSVSHLGPPLKLGPSADPLPMRIRLGGNWRASSVVDAAWDVVLPVDQAPYICIGFEARLPAAKLGSSKEWSAAARIGYDQSHGRDVDGIGGVTAGFGVDLSGFRVDYAWLPYGDLGTSNRMTLAFRF